MNKTELKEKKKVLVNELIEKADKMVIGSLYQTKVNCGIATCKKCMNNKKGHEANHLGYNTSEGKHKTTYISKKIVDEVKTGNENYKYTKKLLQDIAEINLLIMKSKK